MSPHAHEGATARLAVAVLTISDTRTPETDGSGREAIRLLEAAGHAIHDYRIVPDDPRAIADRIAAWIDDAACDAVVTSGGTGVSPRDRTVEAVAGLIDRPLPGFGELFRMLSWAEIGSAAMLSGALGGVARGKPVFALPGSTAAVRLGLTSLVVPELAHLVVELRKQDGPVSS